MPMFEQMLLHDKTRAAAQNLLSQAPNALLVTGAAGSGKHTFAQQLAAKLLDIPVTKLETAPFCQVIDPADTTITIDQIRELQQFLKLKVPGHTPGIHRVVLILDAERMRTEAQNALLKTLEEPPQDTCIILTAPDAGSLLPTIVSRTNELQVLPVSQSSALGFYESKGLKRADISRLYVLSQGQAGLLHSLLHDTEHPMIASVELAKQILAEAAPKRLLRTEALSKDKAAIELLLNALQRICHAALHASATPGKDQTVKQWHRKQVAILSTMKSFSRNANTKLLLDDLFLSI